MSPTNEIRKASRFPLSRAAFKAWLLEQQSIGAVVGKTRDPKVCPLATCAGVDVIPSHYKGGGRYMNRQTGAYGPLPEWANQFAGAVDDELAPDDDIIPVTAGEALRLLSRKAGSDAGT